MSSRRRGSAVLEFTLAGIPLMFVLISTVEMSRGMWLYHTLAYAVNEGARYATMHGNGCVTSPANCGVLISDIAGKIKSAGVGIDGNVMQVTFASSTRTVGPKSLTAALSDSTNWPTNASGTAPDAGGAAGQPVTITSTYLFRSTIAMFWPGRTAPLMFGSFNMYAASRQRILF
jgi:Flp pilus assembly protein TadG